MVNLMQNPLFRRWQVAIAATTTALLSASTLHPVSAAERISVTYGAFERSIPVESLVTYARTGTIDQELVAYTIRLLVL